MKLKALQEMDSRKYIEKTQKLQKNVHTKQDQRNKEFKNQ